MLSRQYQNTVLTWWKQPFISFFKLRLVLLKGASTPSWRWKVSWKAWGESFHQAWCALFGSDPRSFLYLRLRRTWQQAVQSTRSRFLLQSSPLGRGSCVLPLGWGWQRLGPLQGQCTSVQDIPHPSGASSSKASDTAQIPALKGEARISPSWDKGCLTPSQDLLMG